MMAETIICTIITAISGVMIAYMQAQMSQQKKKTEKYEADQEKREARRRKEMLLSLQLNAAVLRLSVVSANALTNGHNNGNVEIARQDAIKAEEAYTAFERELLSEELA